MKMLGLKIISSTLNSVYRSSFDPVLEEDSHLLGCHDCNCLYFCPLKQKPVFFKVISQ